MRRRARRSYELLKFAREDVRSCDVAMTGREEDVFRVSVSDELVLLSAEGPDSDEDGASALDEAEVRAEAHEVFEGRAHVFFVRR